MAEFTADEAKKRNIEKMGEALGTQYSALWQEVALLYWNWAEYVELFGKKSERIELVNRAASYFFRMIQDDLWETTLLRIARVTDPSTTGNKSNLTIQNIPALIDDAKTKATVVKLIEVAVKETAFCRDWRNRHIAHHDLKLALEQPAVPLAPASRLQVKAALKAIAEVMNAVEIHYSKSESRFDLGGTHHGAVSLLYVIHAGLKAQDERSERLKSGKFSDDDFGPKDL